MVSSAAARNGGKQESLCCMETLHVSTGSFLNLHSSLASAQMLQVSMLIIVGEHF